MSPIDKKTQALVSKKITESVQKILDSPELNDLSEKQIEAIAKSYYIDSLKDEFEKEVKKAKINQEELIGHWLSGFTSEHTKRSFKKNLDYFLVWLNGKSILDVDSLVVTKYITYLNGQKVLSDNTIRQRIASLSSFYSDLELWEIVIKNPFKRAKGVPKKKIAVKKSEQIPTNDDLDMLEKYALEQINQGETIGGRGSDKKIKGNILAYCTLKVLRKTGLRVGALNNMKIETNGNYSAVSKGNNVYGELDDEFLSLFKQYNLSQNKPFAGYTEKAFSMWLWRTQSSGELKSLFKNKKYGSHSIRHRFSIDFYNETKDVHELQQRLGHSSLLVTTAYLAGLKNEIIVKKK